MYASLDDGTGLVGLFVKEKSNKMLQSLPRLGFFSVTSLVGEWDEQQISDLMTQGNVTFEIMKGFNLSGGFHVTPVTGFRPSAGFLFNYLSKKLNKSFWFAFKVYY